MSRTLFVALIAVLLCGCSVRPTRNSQFWVLCYRDDTILSNGMYQSNELQLRCSGGSSRKELHFSVKFGEESHPVMDFRKPIKETDLP